MALKPKANAIISREKCQLKYENKSVKPKSTVVRHVLKMIMGSCCAVWSGIFQTTFEVPNEKAESNWARIPVSEDITQK